MMAWVKGQRWQIKPAPAHKALGTVSGAKEKPLISSSCYYRYCYSLIFPLTKNWRFKSRMWIIGSLGTRMSLLFSLPLVAFRYDWLIRRLCLIRSSYLSQCWNECGCSVSNTNEACSPWGDARFLLGCVSLCMRARVHSPSRGPRHKHPETSFLLLLPWLALPAASPTSWFPSHPWNSMDFHSSALSSSLCQTLAQTCAAG